jgi:hypothetical protein
VIVNDVYVDPGDSNRVLLATDRGGVLASSDAGETFTQSNQGISGRKVEALLVDRANPARLIAGVVNDKQYGGVFISTNGGAAVAANRRGARRPRCLRSRPNRRRNSPGGHQPRHLRPQSRRARRQSHLATEEHHRQHDCQNSERDSL